MTIDLTGLPAEVIARVSEIVDEARRAAVPSGDPEPDRTPLRGRFAHETTGGWTAEQFEAARREMSAAWERRMDERLGEITGEQS